jgi:tellurite resistance protein TerC
MTIWLWIGFIALVLGMLALDLGVLNRKAHTISTRAALLWSALCVALALAFNGLIYFLYHYHWLGVGLSFGHKLAGHEAAMQFFTGWVIEQSLSLDNIFVIALIFGYFHVPRKYQHRTLFWGIIGALVMRGVMIAVGVAMLRRFEWIIYVFGVLLLATAVKMLRSEDEKIEPDRNPLVRLARRLYPVSPTFEGERFFTRVDGRRAITPLFLVLLVIESSDVLFAVDSIPAVFGVTRDPFIVFTSNVFAILNLRSLYFVLAAMLEKFRFLKLSLVMVLAYVGVKMLISNHVEIPTGLSLGVVGALLGSGALASIIWPARGHGKLSPSETNE